jgi:hypothetical protein
VVIHDLVEPIVYFFVFAHDAILFVVFVLFYMFLRIESLIARCIF